MFVFESSSFFSIFFSFLLFSFILFIFFFVKLSEQFVSRISRNVRNVRDRRNGKLIRTISTNGDEKFTCFVLSNCERNENKKTRIMFDVFGSFLFFLCVCMCVFCKDSIANQSQSKNQCESMFDFCFYRSWRDVFWRTLHFRFPPTSASCVLLIVIICQSRFSPVWSLEEERENEREISKRSRQKKIASLFFSRYFFVFRWLEQIRHFCFLCRSFSFSFSFFLIRFFSLSPLWMYLFRTSSFDDTRYILW